MRIVFIAPGDIEVPPAGWGALETVVWNQAIQLENLGHDVKIINDTDTNKVYQEVEKYNPDIVHLHYGRHYEMLPYINRKKIITNHDGSFLDSLEFHENIIRKYMYDCIFFILTSWEQDFLRSIGFSTADIKILPNGVDNSKFYRRLSSEYPDYSICLGKIDNRKRQSFLQKLDANIFFVGQNHDSTFNPLDNFYLGSWSRDEVFHKLTNYTNLVLLSHRELQPLVCLEALSAGLGLVISESCSQNLDTSLEFITVIPDHKINDNIFIKQEIERNRNYCNSIDRNIIFDYAKTFDWSLIIQKYLSFI